MLEWARDISLITASSPENLLSTVERYLGEAAIVIESRLQPLPVPASFISYATASAPFQPLSQHHTILLISLTSSARMLEGATRSPSAETTLRRHFGAETAKNLVEFWEDEWVV